MIAGDVLLESGIGETEEIVTGTEIGIVTGSEIAIGIARRTGIETGSEKTKMIQVKIPV